MLPDQTRKSEHVGQEKIESCGAASFLKQLGHCPCFPPRRLLPFPVLAYSPALGCPAQPQSVVAQRDFTFQAQLRHVVLPGEPDGRLHRKFASLRRWRHLLKLSTCESRVRRLCCTAGCDMLGL
ncbi:unnamed protein product [Symbiodinium natans]|uniref:Uncharacterized protein n=1 Tax=Symbiodinium natans TaxID=878477 RepID=A0A812RUA6_9DINO|nr:unnamed protein product [Symbiodinium natans]